MQAVPSEGWLRSEALDRVIDYIATKPFGSSGRIVLTCHEDNAVALGLYESRGFIPTGNVYDDEIELVRTSVR